MVTTGVHASRRTTLRLLSRSPKILQQFSEPEVFGCHEGLATGLLWCQHQNPGCGIGGEGTNMPAAVGVGTMEVVMHR
jgi:hypothetical protein